MPGWILAIAAMFSVQLGSALSLHAISALGPAGTAWLRLTAGAAIFLLMERPSLRSFNRHDGPMLIGLGVTTGVQTIAFLAAIQRIPLGTAVAIEFLGPMSVAALHSHSPKTLPWAGTAGIGVVLVTEPWHGPVNWAGVAFAAIAAVGWAAYIVLTTRVGNRFSGLTGLALTIPVAACAAGIVGIPQAAGHLTFELVAIGVALAVLLPVLPYSFELLALRRMTPTAFGTLMALEPAIGVVLGLVVLHQHLSPIQVTGILLVVLAGAAAQLGEPGLPSADGDSDAQPSTGPVPF